MAGMVEGEVNVRTWQGRGIIYPYQQQIVLCPAKTKGSRTTIPSCTANLWSNCAVQAGQGTHSTRIRIII